MPTNDDRGGIACESDRLAPDVRQIDSGSPFACAVEPHPSNDELERFVSFTDALRDALGEMRRVKELSPGEAAGRGCLSTLRSLHRRGRAELTVYLCESAARGGQFGVLEWLRENGCPWDETTCSGAAENGHLEVLKWWRANDCPWNVWTCAGAAKGGHLEVLRWARANGCSWDEKTCANAAKGGHLEVLKWARANGCPWNEKTCSAAAEDGHLEVLKWARENGCPCEL